MQLMELASLYPMQQVIFQAADTHTSLKEIEAATSLYEVSNSRITIQTRPPGTAQTVRHAAVYIVRVGLGTPDLSTHILSELQAHVTVLRQATTATLILVPPLLPAPNVVEPEVETEARLWDMSYAQLHNEWHLELEDLFDIVDRVHDDQGRLVAVHQIKSADHVTVGLALRYQNLGCHS